MAILDCTKERNELVASVTADLLGPGSEALSGNPPEFEIITESPSERYSVGILSPSNAEMSPLDDAEVPVSIPAQAEDQDEDDEIEEPEATGGVREDISTPVAADDALVESVGLANEFKPSAMGLSYCVSRDTADFRVKVKFALYRSAKWDECAVRRPDDYNSELCSLPEWCRLDTESDLIRSKGKALDKPWDELKTWREAVCCQDWVKELEEKLRKSKIIGTRMSISRKLALADMPTDRVLAAKKIETEDIGRLRCLFSLHSALETLIRQQRGYIRQPYEQDYQAKDLAEGTLNVELAGDGCKPDGFALQLRVFRRGAVAGGDVYSLFLVNTSRETSVFQPVLEVVAGATSKLLPLKSDASNAFTMEEQVLEMLYEDKNPMATGHGCSVEWDRLDGQWVCTTFIPAEPVRALDTTISKLYVEGNSAMERLSRALCIRDLAKSDERDSIIGCLGLFCENYEVWVKTLDPKSREGFEDQAAFNIANCGRAVARMRQGVGLLRTDDKAWNAFVLANEAMLRLFRGYEHKPLSIGEGPDDAAIAWRPFQLAFILLTLESVANPDSTDRNIVDLLWFPTGGGKTEAYQALTAFTIFYRRLVHEERGGGTSVIMRYTLRLLTTQQYQRACSLICACEFIRRRENMVLGQEKISVGLWIGHGDLNQDRQAYIPGRVVDAERRLGEINRNPDCEHPFLPIVCPWCGSSVTRRVANNVFFTACGNNQCAFGGLRHLPVQMIDECLYSEPPSLLFATVDKFAQITWKAESGKFFGFGNNGQRVRRPPELVIQDELHLITSELGSLVGLYEVALRSLCCMDDKSAKVIASTATARCADEQIKALYNGGTFLFPPPGLSIDDSYFARVKINDPGRLYVGIMSSAKTATTTLIRLVASLLQRVAQSNWSNDVKDQFFTLVSYFNSLRELGSFQTWIQADIPERMNSVAKWNSGASRPIENIESLYSQGTNLTRIPKTLQRLKECRHPDPKAVDLVVASNMLSVGIDVDRFGSMVIYGQPKTTAEFIQATSRVGRNTKRPGSGVVFTVYNGMKPRDRSHYEVFPDYIGTFYRYVEPTSVTPFSLPARLKGLHAVLVAILRHNIPDLRGSPGESNTIEDMFEGDDVTRLLENIVKDAGAIDPDELNAVRNELRDLLGEWKKSVVDGRTGQYGRLGVNATDRDLIYASGEQSNDALWPTLVSLRNVDKTVAIRIVNKAETI